MADQRGDIYSNVRCINAVEEFLHVADRTAAIAEHQRGHAHAHEVFRQRQIDYFFGVCMDVNKSRRNDVASRIDDLWSVIGNFFDCDDTALLNADISKEGRISGTIDDAPMTNDQIVGAKGNCSRGNENDEKNRSYQLRIRAPICWRLSHVLYSIGFFQIGTTRFISSIKNWHAAKASPRCGAMTSTQRDVSLVMTLPMR